MVDMKDDPTPCSLTELLLDMRDDLHCRPFFQHNTGLEEVMCPPVNCSVVCHSSPGLIFFLIMLLSVALCPVLCPPSWRGTHFQGFTLLRSSHFQGFTLLRSSPFQGFTLLRSSPFQGFTLPGVHPSRGLPC